MVVTNSFFLGNTVKKVKANDTSTPFFEMLFCLNHIVKTVSYTSAASSV